MLIIPIPYNPSFYILLYHHLNFISYFQHYLEAILNYQYHQMVQKVMLLLLLPLVHFRVLFSRLYLMLLYNVFGLWRYQWMGMVFLIIYQDLRLCFALREFQLLIICVEFVLVDFSFILKPFFLTPFWSLGFRVIRVDQFHIFVLF